MKTFGNSSENGCTKFQSTTLQGRLVEGALGAGYGPLRSVGRGEGGRGIRTMLTWGVPNSYGSETQYRNPVRSADTLGVSRRE